MKTAKLLNRLPMDDFYPASDGQPMAETQVHVLLMMSLYAMLRYHFRRDRVLVAANIFLYYREGDPSAHTSPDVMVVKGVEGRTLRRSFFTWKERAVPSWVLELTSKETAREDQKEKKALYRKLRVREYFLFDPLHEYLPKPLIGYRLVDGKYQRLKADADGGIVSEELGLRFVPDRARLLVYDLTTGERLLNPEETYDQTEKDRIRIAELSAELERLRAKREES
jgi:Uma2 family endonuclease